ncbi:MAG: nucleotidyltransferase domain-containing protein [Candidatus Pacearchaeota archaeon]
MVAKKKTSKKASKKKSSSSSAKKTSKKKTTSKNKSAPKKKQSDTEAVSPEDEISETEKKKFPTLRLQTEHEVALDFASRAYSTFGKIIKSIILFGSTAKRQQVAGSDIDIIIVIDDASIKWSQEDIAHYRETLNELLKVNPYNWNLHINTVKLNTWWRDMMRGDPVILNIIRNGETLIDEGGFFIPLKALLAKGEIKATPEAIYTSLQRAPGHLQRSKSAQLSTIEGIYWSMVDAAHAALIAKNVFPASPEHVTEKLTENLVEEKLLKPKYVKWYKEVLELHKKISHGRIKDLKGQNIDEWQDRAQEFVSVMTGVVDRIVEDK